MGETASRFPIFDADNHYYEALDCCTRHIDPAHRDLAVRYDRLDGKDVIYVGDRLYTYGAVYADHCPTPGTLIVPERIPRSWPLGTCTSPTSSCRPAVSSPRRSCCSGEGGSQLPCFICNP